MSRVSVLLALVLAACGSAPSEQDCARLLDHVIELEMAAGGAAATTPEARAELEAQKKKVGVVVGKDFMRTCTDELPRSQVSCGLAATSLEDLARCDG
jgi:hypothetical protein